MSINKTTFAQIRFKIHEVGESARIDWFLILVIFVFFSILSLISALIFFSRVQVVDKAMVLTNPTTAPVSIDTNTLEKVDTGLKQRALNYKAYGTALQTIPDPAR